MKYTSRRLYLQLGFLLMVKLVYGSVEFQNEVIRSLGRDDRHCFGTASLHLIRFRKMRVQTTDTLWDFMESLLERRNKDKWFEDAYFSLLYDFQKMYVDCLIGKEHGVGKRHIESKRSILYADQKLHKIP